MKVLLQVTVTSLSVRQHIVTDQK